MITVTKSRTERRKVKVVYKKPGYMAVKSAAQCGVRKANILELGGVLSLSEADELERSIAEGRIAMRKRLKHLGRQLCGQAL